MHLPAICIKAYINIKKDNVFRFNISYTNYKFQKRVFIIEAFNKFK